MVLDAVVFHWESLVAEIDGAGSSNDDATQPAGRTIWASGNVNRRTEEGHTRLKVKAVFFYADNMMVAFTDPGWLHIVFNMMTGLFNRVGPKTNIKKTVGIVCHPLRAAGVLAE